MESVDTPIISVLMSVYNEPLEWIRQSIDSILAQTYSDFEFIIVNDNPTSAELCKFLSDFKNKDSRIKVITNPENLGLTKSLNIGLEQCRGKYIARMDADDISLPERFEKQVEFLDCSPGIGVCGSYANMIDENNNIIGRFKLQSKSEDLKNAICFLVPFVHPTVMMRREIILKNYYDEKCIIAQDYNLWLKLSETTLFYNIPEVLFDYRIHANQSKQKAGEKQSSLSMNYTDHICVEKLRLPKLLGDNFIRLRCGGKLNHSEIKELFSYIIDNSSNKEVAVYAMLSYLKNLYRQGYYMELAKTVLYKPRLFIKALFKWARIEF